MQTNKLIALAVTGDEYGGAEKSLVNLVGECSADHRFVLIGPRCVALDRLMLELPTIDSFVLEESQSSHFIRKVVAFKKILDEVCPDILQITLCNPGVAVSLQVAGVLSGMQTIVVEQLVQPIDGNIRKIAKIFISRLVSDHVAVGDASARRVERVSRLPKGTVRTIYNGVPGNDHTSPARSIQFSLDTKLVVGTIARLSPQKGLDNLIRAMVFLPDASLILVGEGAEKENLEKIASLSGVAGRTLFLGWRSDVTNLLASTDVFVLPSNNEAFPLTLVEAMLAKVPIVASNVGSVGEAIVNNETGILLEDRSPESIAWAIIKLISNPQLCQKLKQNAYDKGTTYFTSKVMAESYQSMWEHPRGKLGWTILGGHNRKCATTTIKVRENDGGG